MVSFILVEKKDAKLHIVHSVIDDYIPFCEYFIIPYVLWFLYVACVLCNFVFGRVGKREYYQLIATLGTGLTIFIIFSPHPHCVDDGPHRFTKFAQSIFDLWGNFRIKCAGNEPVRFHGTQPVQTCPWSNGRLLAAGEGALNYRMSFSSRNWQAARTSFGRL